MSAVATFPGVEWGLIPYLGMVNVFTFCSWGILVGVRSGGGRQGRPPKPTALRVLAGDRRPSRQKPPDAPLPVGQPQRPAFVTGYARRVWDRLAPDLSRLGLLREADVESFGAYCLAADRHRRAQMQINREGLFQQSTAGTTMAHPAWRIARDAAMEMLAHSTRFGLTPSDRVGLGVLVPQRPDAPAAGRATGTSGADGLLD